MSMLTRNDDRLRAIVIGGLFYGVLATAQEQPPQPPNSALPADAGEPLKAASQGDIERLLIEAQRLKKLKRFTQPSPGNAYELYTAVLQIDPNNAEAKRGIQFIIDAYLRLAAMYIHKAEAQDDPNMLDRSHYTIRKTLAIDPGNTEALRLRDQLQQLSQQ